MKTKLSILTSLCFVAFGVGYSQGSKVFQMNLLPLPIQTVKVGKEDTGMDRQPVTSVYPNAGNQALVNVKPLFLPPSKSEDASSKTAGEGTVEGIPNSGKMVEILRGGSSATIEDRLVRINPKALPKGMGTEHRIKKCPSTYRIKDGETHRDKYCSFDSSGRSRHSGGNYQPTPSIAYRVEPASRLTTHTIRFKEGSDELADHESSIYLENLAYALINPALENERFVIECHSSAEGSDASNLILSQRRANAIYDFMIERCIDGRSLLAVGQGENYARHSARDPEELRAKDRQVIIYKLAE